MDVSTALAAHAHLLWRGDRFAMAPPGVPTGFAALDEALPGGGWPTGALTELLPERPGIGEVSLLMPALVRCAQADARWVVCIAPPHLPYAPAWQAAGIDLARFLLVRPNSAAEALWATRQALASNACSAVLAWLTVPDHQSLRRLQLAAEAGGGLAFLFRPACAARDFSPAPLRLQLSAAGPRLAVHLIKRRGPRAARPLLIDLARAHAEHAVARPLSAEPAAAGLPACRS